MRRWLVPLALWLLPVTVAAQGNPQPIHPPSATSDFWREVQRPGFRRSRVLLRHARELLSPGQSQGLGIVESRVRVEGAMHRLRLADRLAPSDLEVLFLLAEAASRWERIDASGRTHRLDEQARELYDRIRLLDPDYEAAPVAFGLGLIHTRAHDFALAAQEYERAIAASFIANETMYGNLAEVTMLAGELGEAVAYFERAVELANRSGHPAELLLWGWAVALDRLGEHNNAIEHTSRALALGGGTMEPLHQRNVFYEPAYEIHWYEGLGNEALARSATGRLRTTFALAAQQSFRRFLSEGGETSLWSDMARQHITRLGEVEARGGRR